MYTPELAVKPLRLIVPHPRLAQLDQALQSLAAHGLQVSPLGRPRVRRVGPRRDWADLHEALHPLRVLEPVHGDDCTQVGPADQAQAFLAEMHADRFQIGDVLLDTHPRHVGHRIGSPAVAHVVEDDGAFLSEPGQNAFEEEAPWDDNGVRALSQYAIVEAKPWLHSQPPFGQTGRWALVAPHSIVRFAGASH